jgi:arsenate reductase-like glutaredoxin family protein
MSNVNVKRLVENIRSGTNIYTPLVELVVNAIQAIDAKGIQNGLVEIEVLRDGQADMVDRLDYKTAGIDKDHLARWSKTIGWETLLNRAGTTFRKLSDADRNNLTEKRAMALMLGQPSMIKRPVLEIGGKLLVGFKPEIYAAALGT